MNFSRIITFRAGMTYSRTSLSSFPLCGEKLIHFVARPLQTRTSLLGSQLVFCARRSLTKHPDLNRDSFVFASNSLQKVKHLRSCVLNNVLAVKAVVFPNDLGEMRTYYGFRTTYRRFISENGLPRYTLHS